MKRIAILGPEQSRWWRVFTTNISHEWGSYTVTNGTVGVDDNTPLYTAPVRSSTTHSTGIPCWSFWQSSPCCHSVQESPYRCSSPPAVKHRTSRPTACLKFIVVFTSVSNISTLHNHFSSFMASVTGATGTTSPSLPMADSFNTC